MRVTTRAKNGTRRAGLGAKVVGLGLATLVAIGVSASPAAAASVDPDFVEGNPPLECPEGAEGFRIDPPADTTVPVSPGDATGTVIIDFTASNTLVSFNTTGNIAVRQVTVKGGPDANRYVYDADSTPTSFPDGIAMDTNLVSPLNPGGQVPTISHVDFCVIEGNGS
ncbi:hypothetical protein ACFQ6S_40270 [Streptomyces sp. NPDC056479]|uniref:hypothetical protein n=1 Tax=Streptomyces sp. NPDC056479 TaxID=3345832 RepID=UPI0036C49687